MKITPDFPSGCATDFEEDTSAGAPLCRWKNGETILDVMPLDDLLREG